MLCKEEPSKHDLRNTPTTRTNEYQVHAKLDAGEPKPPILRLELLELVLVFFQRRQIARFFNLSLVYSTLH
jgi:hypothetical protein